MTLSAAVVGALIREQIEMEAKSAYLNIMAGNK